MLIIFRVTSRGQYTKTRSLSLQDFCTLSRSKMLSGRLPLFACAEIELSAHRAKSPAQFYLSSLVQKDFD